MTPEDIQTLTDDQLYDQYQDAKAHGPVLLLDALQLEIAQRWEARFETAADADVIATLALTPAAEYGDTESLIASIESRPWFTAESNDDGTYTITVDRLDEGTDDE